MDANAYVGVNGRSPLPDIGLKFYNMPHITQSQLTRAVQILKQGGVVLFPTETVYGLAADATNRKALRRLRLLKGRAREKTFPLIVSSFAMAKRYAIFSPRLLALAKRYWPGALTIIAPVRPQSGLAPDVICHGTIAIRVSSHPVARSLSRRLNGPIIATSANHSGDPCAYTTKEALASLGKSVEILLDAGPLSKRASSTIIKEEDGKITVLRRGSIKIPKWYVAESKKKL